jgi:hypothetical protein
MLIAVVGEWRTSWLSVCQLRNSFGDRCDITAKSAADLAKNRKGQVPFTALNSTKITSI